MLTIGFDFVNIVNVADEKRHRQANNRYGEISKWS